MEMLDRGLLICVGRRGTSSSDFCTMQVVPGTPDAREVCESTPLLSRHPPSCAPHSPMALGGSDGGTELPHLPSSGRAICTPRVGNNECQAQRRSRQRCWKPGGKDWG